MDLSNISKAIAGGIAAVIVGELARYGWQPSTEVVNAGGVLLTALVSYLVGHIVVFVAPANKPRLLK